MGVVKTDSLSSHLDEEIAAKEMQLQNNLLLKDKNTPNMDGFTCDEKPVVEKKRYYAWIFWTEPSFTPSLLNVAYLGFKL